MSDIQREHKTESEDNAQRNDKASEQPMSRQSPAEQRDSRQDRKDVEVPFGADEPE